MRISKIAAALLLPLAAVATEPLTTTTSTSYLTLTKTITIQRAAIETISASNSTVVLSTPTGSSKPAVSTPAMPTGGASTLSGAPMAFVAVAGAVAAALL